MPENYMMLERNLFLNKVEGPEEVLNVFETVIGGKLCNFTEESNVALEVMLNIGDINKNIDNALLWWFVIIIDVPMSLFFLFFYFI